MRRWGGLRKRRDMEDTRLTRHCHTVMTNRFYGMTVARICNLCVFKFRSSCVFFCATLQVAGNRIRIWSVPKIRVENGFVESAAFLHGKKDFDRDDAFWNTIFKTLMQSCCNFLPVIENLIITFFVKTNISHCRNLMEFLSKKILKGFL